MKIKNIGKVLQVRDGIIDVEGISKVGYNELVEIKSEGETIFGLALNLEETSVGIVVLDDYLRIKEGDIVEATGNVLHIKVDSNVIGKVINPLGVIIDGKKELACPNGTAIPIEKVAPSIIERKNVSRSLYTGILAVDAGIPIGKGQRELVIGDRLTGKASFCVDAVINQKGKDVKCIYVSIGQKATKVAQLKATFNTYGALNYTTIIAANASDPVALQYIAPYAGCALAEYFAEKGEDVLVIYDDLSQHAWAYRQISLLLKRPAGREAYPGDIFYLHSRLLERAIQYSDKNGGGSVTALPIIETLAGDISAYIPTNVISITDGQVFFDLELFNAGQKPAISVGTSVSRVGSSAQIIPMKQVAGKLKLELAQYRELQAFAQFGSDLDKETTLKLKRGALLMEILKQPQYSPYQIEEEILILFSATSGLLDNLDLLKVKDFIKMAITNAKDSLKIIKKACDENRKLNEQDTNKIKEEILALM